jgi:hypothetical protein
LRRHDGCPLAPSQRACPVPGQRSDKQPDLRRRPLGHQNLVERTTRFIVPAHLAAHRGAENLRYRLVESAAIPHVEPGNLGTKNWLALRISHACRPTSAPASPWHYGSKEHSNGFLRRPRTLDIIVRRLSMTLTDGQIGEFPASPASQSDLDAKRAFVAKVARDVPRSLDPCVAGSPPSTGRRASWIGFW